MVGLSGNDFVESELVVQIELCYGIYWSSDLKIPDCYLSSWKPTGQNLNPEEILGTMCLLACYNSKRGWDIYIYIY